MNNNNYKLLGKYKVYQDGKLLSSSENLITTAGASHIMKYLAGQVGNIAATIAVGLGSTAATLTDKSLEFELTNIPVDVLSPDFENYYLVFKGTLPETFSGKIYEIGLWSDYSNTSAGDSPSKLLVSFDPAFETWAGADFFATNARVGATGLRLNPTTSATESDTLVLPLNLSGYSDADLIKVAINNANANTASMTVRFRTDASNYYSFTTATPGSGYSIKQYTKGSAVVTGTPSWANITSIYVGITAGAGGAADALFDAIRIEDVDTLNPLYVLISRTVLGSPLTKDVGKAYDIEYSLDINIA